MGERLFWAETTPEVRPAAAKAGDYRAHQTTGGRLAAPDMSDQPRHRMAGDYRTGSAAAPLELPPATGSSRKSRRFQASSTTPARSSRRGAGMVPSRHQPANVNLMGMEQLKLFKRALEVGDMNKYALRVSSPINPNRCAAEPEGCQCWVQSHLCDILLFSVSLLDSLHDSLLRLQVSS